MVNKTHAFRHSKIEYMNKGKKLKPSFFEYVNGHFSVKITHAGLRTQLVEYVN